VGLAGGAVIVAKQAFNDQCQTKGENEAVKMIEVLDAFEEQTLDDNTGRADNNGNDDKRRPIANADMAQQRERREPAHHMLRAMRELDAGEHAENAGKSKTQQRVK